MFLDFEKWHGCLNDFLVVWISDLDGDVVLDSLKRQGVRLCDRRAGVGGDGVLVLQTQKRGELTPDRLTIINSDGSIAKNCGNGLRVAALSVLKAHREKGDPKELPEMVTLSVEGRAMDCRFLRPGQAFPFVAVDMGVPRLNRANAWHGAAVEAVKKLGKELALPWLADDVGTCDLGNPHVVIQSDDVTRDIMLKVGPALQTAIAGLDGVNVHLIKSEPFTAKDTARAGHELGQDVSELYTAYVWERGAGETMACGSGACALVACAMESGLVQRDAWVAVDMPGGRLYVRHEAADEEITLAGPGAHVYTGKVSI